jgi:hypothetical protein
LSYSAPGAPAEDAKPVIEQAPVNRAAARKQEAANRKAAGKKEKGSSFFKD